MTTPMFGTRLIRWSGNTQTRAASASGATAGVSGGDGACTCSFIDALFQSCGGSSHGGEQPPGGQIFLLELRHDRAAIEDEAAVCELGELVDVRRYEHDSRARG